MLHFKKTLIVRLQRSKMTFNSCGTVKLPQLWCVPRLNFLSIFYLLYKCLQQTFCFKPFPCCCSTEAFPLGLEGSSGHSGLNDPPQLLPTASWLAGWLADLYDVSYKVDSFLLQHTLANGIQRPRKNPFFEQICSNFLTNSVINRPSVTGAVLQTPP